MTLPVRVCLVGAGRVAKVHANSLVNHVPAGELVAIVDTAPEVLKNTADQFDIGERYSSLEEALDGSNFNAVIITIPTFAHASSAIAAASAGKHIFLEKPMALGLEEGDAIIHAVQRTDVLL